MGIVLGPYDAGDWLTMKMLKDHIADLVKRSGKKYELARKRDISILKEYMSKTLEEAA